MIKALSACFLLAAAMTALSGCPASDGGEDENAQVTEVDIESLVIVEEPVVEEAMEASNPSYNPMQPLSEQFAAIRAGTPLPDDVMEVAAAEMAALAEAEIVNRAVNVGDSAPGFALPANSGGAVALETALTHGPVVLVFFRGGW